MKVDQQLRSNNYGHYIKLILSQCSLLIALKINGFLMFSRGGSKRSNGKKRIDFSFNLKLNILIKADLITTYAMGHVFNFTIAFCYFSNSKLFEVEKKSISFKYPQKQLNSLLLGAE